ncbi:MAG: hypothetical protein E6149_09365, partial [Peptoniphilus harei]|nr:hypothetical protein [Peptoniphilus harei]
DLSIYIEKIKEFLFLKDSNFDTEKLEQSEYNLYLEIQRRIEEKEEQEKLELIDRLKYYYLEYGNRELNFEKFRELAKLLKVSNKNNNGIVISVKKINDVIEQFGYKFECSRKGRKKVTVYKFLKI